MNCRICGVECPPGAKLCRDCAAARKRAFAATVTQPLLVAAAGAAGVRAQAQQAPRARPRFAPRPRRAVLQSPATSAIREVQAGACAKAASGTERRPPRLRLAWIGGAIGIGAGLSFAVLRMLAHGPGDAGEVAPATVELPRAVSPAAMPAADVAPEPVLSPPAAAVAGDSGATQHARKVALPRASARKRSPAPEAPKQAPVAAPPPVAVEPAPLLAVPPPAAEPVRRDPLQPLNDALTRCAREDVLTRPDCEQRARTRYCGNVWGQVAQCPIGPATDHGS
jgi:hypothetical protein